VAPRCFPRSRWDDHGGSGLLESHQPISYVSLCRGRHSPAERSGLACHRSHQSVRRRPRLLSRIARARRERIDRRNNLPRRTRRSTRSIIVRTPPPKLQLPQAKNRHAGPCSAGAHSRFAALFVVGDRYGDMELARNARARSVLVRTGYGEGELAWHAAKWASPPDFVAEDLTQAAEWILRQQK